MAAKPVAASAASATVSAHSLIPTSVIVHPLVLLSATDHYMRVNKETSKRVVGVLLGAKEIAGERDSWKISTHEGQVWLSKYLWTFLKQNMWCFETGNFSLQYSQAGILNVTNSFALPFEEDSKDPKIWFLDHNYLENMYAMFKKVNGQWGFILCASYLFCVFESFVSAREKIVGWYSTGPKIRTADLEINEVFKKYTKNPVLVIIDVQPQDEMGIPTDAYMAVEEVKDVFSLQWHFTRLLLNYIAAGWNTDETIVPTPSFWNWSWGSWGDWRGALASWHQRYYSEHTCRAGSCQIDFIERIESEAWRHSALSRGSGCRQDAGQPRSFFSLARDV